MPKRRAPRQTARSAKATSRTAKGERTRERLLAVAFRLFEQKGFEHTTLRDIAAKARVSLGLLYRYYPSKDALVIELYDRLSQEFARRTETLPDGSFGQRFVFVLQTSLGVLERQREALRALIPALTVSPGHPLFIPGGQPSQARVQAKFVEAVTGASDAPAGAARLGEVLYLAHLTVVLAWLLDRSPEQVATRRALDLMNRFAPLASTLLTSPALAALVAPLSEVLQLGVYGKSQPQRASTP